MVKSTSSRQDKTVNKKSQSGWQQVWKDIQAASGISGRGTNKKKAQVEKEEKLPKTPTKLSPSTRQKSVAKVTSKSRRAAVDEKDIQVVDEEVSSKRRLRLPKLLHLSKRKALVLVAGVVLLGIFLRFKEDIFAPFPPAPNVVASFDGGQITVEDIEKHLTTLVPDEEMRKQLQTPEGYQRLVQEMISDEIVRRWAKEKKTDKKEEITHVMQHITEEVNIDELHTQMHKGQMGVNESDIKAYYDANRKDFGEQTLTQARDQIRTTLQGQKEDTFVQNYIQGLKNKASITRDVSILEIPEPEEYEVKNYFDANRNKYEGKQFEEVASIVKEEVRKEKDKSYFTDNADRTLFNVNSKRYTLGEFGKEYQELPAEFLAQYQGTDGKQQLVERIIERLLLYEDSLSQVSLTESKEKTDEMKIKVMAQILEQEEVDDKIKITDEEVKKFYEENKAEMVQPPQSKIRQIMIKSGQTDDEKKRAQQKAEEAYKKLVPGPLKKGIDFASVAKEYSEDEATKNQGGEVKEWIGEKPDFLSELQNHELHQQILAVEKAQISLPFESGDSLYIIQVIDRGQPKQLSFEEVKEPISDRLREQKHDELAGKLSDELQKRVKSTIYTRTLKKLVKN